MSRSFGRAFSYMVSANILAAIIGAISIVIAIRSLSPADWAATAIIVGLGPALGVGLSLGSVTYTVRELARETDGGRRRERYAEFLLRRSVIGIIVVGAGLVSLLFRVDPILTAVLVVAGVRFLRSGTSVLMSSEKRFFHIALLTVLEKLVCLGVLFTAVMSGRASITALPTAFVVSYLFFAVSALVIERPNAPFALVLSALRTPMRVWTGSGRFGVASLVGPAQQADVSTLAFVAGQYQAGLLGAGSRLTGGLNVFGAALSSVVLPYFASDQGVGSRSGVPARKSIAAVAIIFAGFVGVAILTPVWVPVLLGSEYLRAELVVSCYVLLSLVMTAMQPLMSVMQAWDRERFVMWLALLQATLGLGAIAVFGSFSGATGAAVAQLMVATVFLCVLALAVRAEWRTRKV